MNAKKYTFSVVGKKTGDALCFDQIMLTQTQFHGPFVSENAPMLSIIRQRRASQCDCGIRLEAETAQNMNVEMQFESNRASE